jgi:hypothetical protein
MLEAAALWFLAAAVVVFLITGATAPLQTLAWWAGGERREGDDAPDEPATASTPRRFIVYLGGVDVIDGASHSPRERQLLDRLKADIPDAVIVDTVFPYAVNGEPLTRTPGLFGWLWRALEPAPEAAKRPLLAQLVNIRNIFQVLVSADRRYGPEFNAAVAAVILKGLREASWRPGVRARVSLIGYSGGAQVAAGAAETLARTLDGPIDLVSIGGVIAAPDGLLSLSSLHQLVGGRDTTLHLAAVAFPGRWPIAAASAWNRAVGRIHRSDLGPMTHRGETGYLGERPLPGSTAPRWIVTLEAVETALEAARTGDLLS